MLIFTHCERNHKAGHYLGSTTICIWATMFNESPKPFGNKTKWIFKILIVYKVKKTAYHTCYVREWVVVEVWSDP